MVPNLWYDAMKYVIYVFIGFIFLTSCSKAPLEEQSTHYQIAQARKQRIHQEQQKKQKYLIIVDAGHGEFDFGAHTKLCKEKQLCLTTAILVEKHLKELGYRVLMTRNMDRFLPLKQRVALANQSKGNLFVSLHYNAAKNTAAHGMEVYYYNKKSKTRALRSKCLAQYVLSKMLANTGAISRGVKAGNFCVIRETTMPAILIEGGFITNSKEAKLLNDRKYLDKIAFGISQGIDRFLTEDKLTLQ